jgi:hypothetical protein
MRALANTIAIFTHYSVLPKPAELTRASVRLTLTEATVRSSGSATDRERRWQEMLAAEDAIRAE